jgi:hypothetical protein
VKNDVSQFVLALLTLVAGSAAEELLPKMAGVGFPVLFAATVFFSRRRRVADAVAFAVAAGAAEDALSTLPAATSAGFFLLVTALARWTPVPRVVLALGYPAYQMWLRLWTMDVYGSVFVRILVALPVGLATVAVVSFALERLERKAAIHAT